MKGHWIFLIICGSCLLACEESEILPADPAGNDPTDTLAPGNLAENYFPPLQGDSWDTVSPDSMKWNTENLRQLLEFLGSSNTYGFIILKKGRIATEHYWNDWNQHTSHPIASAGKSITSVLIGLAQQQGLLTVREPTSAYLGNRWTSMAERKEKMIQLRHHLSMTTGLDESDDQCTSSSCLKYKADAGQRWVYHNGPYNLLHKVLEKVSGQTIDEFTKTMLAVKIGMRNWSWTDHTLDLSTRDMARFGLLIENEGVWNGENVIVDKAYFQAMVTSSNPFNKAYGYLWWLNGKSGYMIPGENDVKEGKLVKHAPADMFAAMGKGDIKIYVVPSLDIVVVRHGDDTGTNTFGPSSFDEALWQRLGSVMNLDEK